VQAPDRSEAVLLGGVSAGSATILAAAVLASLVGSLTAVVSGLALVAGGIAGVLAVWSGRPGATTEGRFTRWDWLALVAFALVSLRQFLWLVFERQGELLTLLPHNYGDLPLHWTYVRNLASGAPFWPENPILTHARLRYPLGVDLLTAAFVALGLGLPFVLQAMGLVGSLLSALALRRWGGAFAVAGFLFCGGVAGLTSLAGLRLVDVDAMVAWKNLYLALFVPQRGFLLALPAGLVLLESWRSRLLRGEPQRLASWVEGLLWGTLPLVHLHTFAFVSLMFGLWSLATGRWRAGLPTLAVAFVPASWGVMEVTGLLHAAGTGAGPASSLVGWAPGWVMGAEPPLVFLTRNFGFWLPLVVAAVFVAVRTRRTESLLVLVPSLGLFVSLFFVRLAPWAWDNTKLMLWCLVAILPALESLVLARLGAGLRAAALALLFASGLESLLWGCMGPLPRLQILDRAEYEGVCEALARVPTTRVATLQTFNHPVALCGRALVAGYPGHLWSHGLEASAVEARLRRLMLGEPGWQEDADALGASHVFWGVREASAFSESKRPWEDLGPPVASGSWGALYHLR
jgi:hypothetical protein